MIVDRAGGSLATVYKLFGNKDGLLKAMVFERELSSVTAILAARNCSEEPAETLHRIAAELEAHLLNADFLALVRIVMARSIEDAQFAKEFYDRTAMRTRAGLEDLFEIWRKADLGLQGDPQMLADTFMGLIVSDMHHAAISHGSIERLTTEQFSQRTDLFLRGAGLLPRPIEHLRQ